MGFCKSLSRTAKQCHCMVALQRNLALTDKKSVGHYIKVVLNWDI